MNSEKQRYLKEQQSCFSGLFRVMIIILLVLLFLYLFTVIFSVTISAFVRENNAVVVDEENKEIIDELLKIDLANIENAPAINQPTYIEYLVSFRRTVVTVNYSDGEYEYRIKNYFPSPLVSYIEHSGYNVYLHSDDFKYEVIKITVILIVEILGWCYLKKMKG